jgi:phospholipid/cholesterol/gamma-HCH transport system substrate-binding protein
MGEDSTARSTRQRRRPLYGGLIIGALIAGALLVFFLADIIAAFERRYSIVVLVPDAPGIAAGSPVWVGGKRVGEVLAVGFMPIAIDTLGRLWVSMELPRHVQEHIRADSRVRITAQALVGERVIDISPGTPAAPVLADGDTLRSRRELSIDMLTDRAAALRSELDTILVQVNAVAPLVRTRIADAERAFAAMDAAMLEVQQVRTDLQANPGLQAMRDADFRQAMQRVRQQVEELPAALGQLQQRYGAAGDVAPALRRLQARADTLRLQLDAAAALLDQPDGFAGRLRQDPALLNAVNAARASLDSLVAEVRRNPQRFVF